MKNKSIYLRKLVTSVFATILLIYFMIKTTSPKIIFVPFLICGISMIGKSISLLMDKKKYATIFDKTVIISFILFWFGFIIMWCYTSFKQGNPIQTIFTIPFWIAGIYIVKKKIFKPKEKNNNEKSKIKLNIDIRILISALLMILVLLSGIAMLFFGIMDTYRLNSITKGYITTTGYFNNYDVFNVDEDGITYKLTYIYTADGNEYSITTDYGTNYIPEPNSSREIKYNPNNPEEATLTGTNNKNGLIFAGAFFTFGSLTFVFVALSIKGYFDKFKIDVIRAYIGFVLFIVGIGVIFIQTGTTMSLIETIKSLGLWLFIPIILIIVGIHQFVIALRTKE